MTVSIEIPEQEPPQLTIGNTWTWKKNLSNYLPSNEWVLTYALVMTGSLITITASDDNDSHFVEVSPAVTAEYDAGTYDYQATVTRYEDKEADPLVILEKYTIYKGQFEVLPAFSAKSTGYDARSFAKQNLDALETILPDILSNKAASYSIAGRSMAFRNLDEWQTSYNFWARRVAIEDRKAGRKPSNIIRVHLR